VTLLLAALTPSFAAETEPATEGFSCTAVWTGPAPGCPIDTWMIGDATRRTLAQADHAARRELANLLATTGRELAARGGNWDNVDFGLCEATALDRVTVECSNVVADRDGDLCFVTFDDQDCWDGTVFTFDAAGWRAEADARRGMCAAVDDALVARNWSNLEEDRRTCGERCLFETRVSCPSP
jgi:hypothetical protein